MNLEEYNRCVDLCSDSLYRFILKNICDEEMAKDIIQDSYEKLWRHHKEIEFVKSKSYLFSSAYHTIIDLIRKNSRKDDFNNINPDLYYHSVQYSDLKEVLDNALKLLPESQRSVLMLRDYEGYHYDEIGKITGLKETQVKVYIYRARMFLKQYLGKIEVLL